MGKFVIILHYFRTETEKSGKRIISNQMKITVHKLKKVQKIITARKKLYSHSAGGFPF